MTGKGRKSARNRLTPLEAALGFIVDRGLTRDRVGKIPEVSEFLSHIKKICSDYFAFYAVDRSIVQLRSSNSLKDRVIKGFHDFGPTLWPGPLFDPSRNPYPSWLLNPSEDGQSSNGRFADLYPSHLYYSNDDHREMQVAS